MPVIELYSERLLREQGKLPDILTYDAFSEKLRRQLFYAFEEVLGIEADTIRNQLIADSCVRFVRFLRSRHGAEALHPPLKSGSYEGQDCWRDLKAFVLNHPNIPDLLNAVQSVAIYFPDKAAKTGYSEDVNRAFNFARVGYQLEGTQIVRIDSTYMHADVVKPALMLLNGPEWVGPENEFRTALEHYRDGNTKESNQAALNALESTMKAICKLRGWTHDPGAQAKHLIAICFDKGLVPLYWASAWSGLRCILESGVPTGRNKAGGHGQGPVIQDAPPHLASYILHMTGAAIVYLIEAHKAMK